MITNNEVRNYLFNALTVAVDDSLRKKTFLRKGKSHIYSREFKSSKQSIWFAADWFPKAQPGSDAHILPMMRIEMKQLGKSALDLVKGNEMLLARAPEIILNQPIEFAAPKDCHERWFATGAEEFVEVCSSINAFILRWVTSVLDDIGTADDLVKIYESNDPRFLKQQHWHIYVAAAYMQRGEIDSARELVLAKFGKPGLRKRFAALFETLNIP